MDSDYAILVPAMLVCSSLMGQDVLIEILKRLPIKTLCRFLCVSRYWKSLISSTLFITTRDKSFTTPPILKPYLQVRDNSHSYIMCNHQLGQKEIHFPFRLSTDKTVKTKSKRIITKTGGGLYFVDVIQGVVCVSYSSESGFDSSILWNPAIHKYVSLPCLPFPVDLEAVKKKKTCRCRFRNLDLDEFLVRAKFDSSLIGFGYDTSNHLFKVVRIWIPGLDDSCRSSSILLPTYEVVVSSTLKRRVTTAPDILRSCKVYEGSRTSCFVNGNIHWIIRTPSGRNVLMFDCKSESFRILELPQGVFYSVSNYSGYPREALQKTKLMEYAGMLSVVVDYCLDQQHKKTYGDLTYVDMNILDISHYHTELWVLEEQGVAAKWAKLYRFKNTISDSLLLELDICRDSFVDLAPFSLEQWNNSTRIGKRKYAFHAIFDKRVYDTRYHEIVSARVYEESMFLMDHPNAHSYSHKHQEEIVCKQEKTEEEVRCEASWWRVMVNNYGCRPDMPTPPLRAPRNPVTVNTPVTCNAVVVNTPVTYTIWRPGARYPRHRISRVII